MNDDLIKEIDDILPQTQCTRCGYPSCLDYATAIANGAAEINQCPPGGEAGILKLSKLLNKMPMPLNPENGVIKLRQVAVIDEDVCIGCTLCIKACPVDAILGSNKMMHSIIEAECTGCDLCVPACPVDCIDMIDIDNPEWLDENRSLAKSRFEWHKARKKRDSQARDRRLKQHAPLQHNADDDKNKDNKKTDILANILSGIKKQ